MRGPGSRRLFSARPHRDSSWRLVVMKMNPGCYGDSRMHELKTNERVSQGAGSGKRRSKNLQLRCLCDHPLLARCPEVGRVYWWSFPTLPRLQFEMNEVLYTSMD
jgi:hypothetical protein